jgi:mono/diheme cytochrome c family protein
MSARQLGIWTLLVVVLLASGCDRLDMYDQPRYDPLAASNFFADGRSARPQVEGTIARGHLNADVPLQTGKFQTGKESGQFVSQIPEGVWQKLYDRDPRRFNKPLSEVKPPELRLALLERGQERYNIYCSVCHSRLGDGNGMIVRRGFRKPPSFHIERLRNAPDGHFFDVITRGIGAMPSYASRIAVVDRWAIVAYIRALQLSENAGIDDVPEAERSELLKQTPVSAAAQGATAPNSTPQTPEAKP